jgi:hypothetical protein
MPNVRINSWAISRNFCRPRAFYSTLAGHANANRSGRAHFPHPALEEDSDIREMLLHVTLLAILEKQLGKFAGSSPVLSGSVTMNKHS